MSWDEVHKINSDFQREPLNFNNYINDISTFGQYSYVLDPENSKLWRELLTRSLTMFGHSAIHETVYNRLTDEDVDYMLRKNARLGQSFNSFYDSSVFASGVIDSILKTLTATTYNVLEMKFQCGINRYVSEMTSGDTAGEWLGTVFEVDALKTKTNITSIISDSDLWNNTIMANESLRYVVCLSAATIDWFAGNDSDAYISFINEVCNSTKATMDLFTALDGNEKLTTFMATESVVTVMASKTESMVAVTYMTAPFAAMIASETAMTIVAASEVAVNVIVEAMTNVVNSETALTNIKVHMTSIEEDLSTIANSETNITEITEAKIHIEEVVASLQKTTSQADILISNIGSFINSDTAMVALVNNETVRERLVYTPVGLNAICKNAAAATIVQGIINTLDLTKILTALSDTTFFTSSGETRKNASGADTKTLVSTGNNIVHLTGMYTSSATLAAYAIASLTGATIASESAYQSMKNKNVYSLRGLSCRHSGGNTGYYRYVVYTAV